MIQESFGRERAGSGDPRTALNACRSRHCRGSTGLPLRYPASNRRDCSASLRRTSRRFPLTRAIFMSSYAVAWWRNQAITADSARRSIGIRCVPVPLPIGVACLATASASPAAKSPWHGAKSRNARIAPRKSSTYAACLRSRRFASACRRLA